MIYAHYARCRHLAVREGSTLYEVNERLVTGQIEQARRAGLHPQADEYKNVEYPPLALATIVLPSLFLEDLPAAGEWPFALQLRYVSLYRAQMVAWDLLTFLLLGALVRRWFAHEPPGRRAGRLLAYHLGACTLGFMLYDRMDLPLGTLLLVALALLSSRRHYAWSFLVLAAAVCFKLVPLALAPLWALASLPADVLRGLATPAGWGRAAAALARRLALLAALVVAWFAPFCLAAGPRCLGFLAYHRERGLEIGSSYASALMGLGLFGHPVTVTFSHSSFDVRSPLSPLLADLSLAVTAGLLLVALALAALAFIRLAGGERAAGPAPLTPGQLNPPLVVAVVLLVLTVLMAASKVFSPQYLIWLVPLAPLAPFPGRGRRLYLGWFLATCVATTAIYPVLYKSHLVGTEVLPAEPATMRDPITFPGPTPLGVAVLAARNALVLLGGLGLMAYLCTRISNARE
jgi:hypothetical protein